MITLLDLQENEEDLRRIDPQESDFLAVLLLGGETLETPQRISADKSLIGMQKDAHLTTPVLLKILLKRLELYGGEYSTAAIGYAGRFCATPAQAVMWAHALWTLSADGPVTLSALLDNPERSPLHYGVPTEEGYRRVWLSQKRSGAPHGNFLDSAEAWRRETVQ